MSYSGDSGTYIRESGSPNKDSGSPMEDSASLIRYPGSPFKDSASPIGYSGSPIGKSASPIRDSGSPIMNSGSPNEGSENLSGTWGSLLGRMSTIRPRNQIVMANCFSYYNCIKEIFYRYRGTDESSKNIPVLWAYLIGKAKINP